MCSVEFLLNTQQITEQQITLPVSIDSIEEEPQVIVHVDLSKAQSSWHFR